jgi:nucleotide-binding universal stress UspA family protein
MEKLTGVMAIVERAEDAATVLAKSATIARCFGAHLEVLAADAEVAQIVTAHCSEYIDIQSAVSLRNGKGAGRPDKTLRHFSTMHPDLVVKAPAGDQPLHRWTLTANDWRLADECPVPVLLVRPRPWGAPVRFAAAVDISDEDQADLRRSILHAAGFMALGVLGEIDILYSEREAREERVRMERAVSLAQLVREYYVGCEHIQRVEGEPEQTLPPILQKRRYDVLVLGAQPRRQGLAQCVPSTASRLVEATSGDVLLAKPPASAAAVRQPQLLREQRANQAQEFA